MEVFRKPDEHPEDGESKQCENPQCVEHRATLRRELSMSLIHHVHSRRAPHAIACLPLVVGVGCGAVPADLAITNITVIELLESFRKLAAEAARESST